jgi:hypothetical protein
MKWIKPTKEQLEGLKAGTIIWFKHIKYDNESVFVIIGRSSHPSLDYEVKMSGGEIGDIFKKEIKYILKEG